MRSDEPSAAATSSRSPRRATRPVWWCGWRERERSPPHESSVRFPPRRW
jgi:hypothetical protein